MNNLETTNNKVKKFFDVEEDSNYKIIMTYGREDVIEFEQFTKLANAIFEGTGDFVTINKRIIQKKDIRMIEPTRDLTERQKQIRTAKDQAQKLSEKERQEAIDRFALFRKNWMDNKYGENDWNLADMANRSAEIQKDYNNLTKPE